MIILSSDFSHVYVRDAAFMHILCLKSAFFGSALEEDMWIQTENDRICGVIARFGGRLYIWQDGTDPEEISVFMNTVGFCEIFTSYETALQLGLTIQDSFDTLVKKADGKNIETCEISLKALYDALIAGDDGGIDLPSFEIFAPDFSHRLRHNAAAATAESYGAAIAFCCNNGGIINGIVVDKSKRGQGLGSMLLNKLLKNLCGDVFVCSGKENTEFYVKNGFELIGKAVIAR